ncbi:DnaD domain protein, partial [Limosilactobacillus gastricus]|uniref:DnaD domain protein n=1 Tax=Limosilactobacillus gastricus TaxID=227942 RepID=UPI0026EEFC2C
QSKHIQSKQEQKESKNELINNDLGKNADLISLVENQWGPINEEAKQLINSFTLIYDHDLVKYVLETFNKNGHSKAGLINYLTASLKNIAAKGLTSREEVIAEHQKKFRKVEGNNNKPNPPTKVIPIFKIGDDWE